jgi:prefoldin subunit 5
MAEVVNRRVNIYIDESAGAVALERLTKKENELVAAIEKGKKAGKDLTREMTELANTQGKIGQLKDVMDGKVLPSLRMAEAAVGKLRRELRNIPADSEAAGNKLQELRKAEATLNQVRKAVTGVDNSLKEVASGSGLKRLMEFAGGAFLGGGLLGVAAGALSGLKSFFSGAVEEALQAEEATARFRAQLDNLGRLDVFDRLTAAADEFANSLGFIDNDEIVGVFEQLINYGKLTEEQIKQLTPVIIDFAAKQRIELPEATNVIIKALEGNGKALKTYGIDIKDAKDETEAFGVIMEQLKPKVDGAAKALGDTTSGQIKKTRQEIANLQEEIGTKTLPLLQKFYQSISVIVGGISDLFSGTTQAFKKFKADQAKQRGETLESFATLTGQQQAAIVNNQTKANLKVLEEFKKQSDPKLKEILRKRLVEDTVYLEQLLTQLSSKADSTRLGINNDKPGSKTGAGKTKSTPAETRAEFEEIVRQNEKILAPILAGFREINEAALKDVETIKDKLKKNLITPAEADQALQNIERVLSSQRDTLAKKFDINPERLGADPAVQSVEQLFARDSEMGAKDLGKKVMGEIYEGAEEFIENADKDPIEEWLGTWGDALMIWSSQVADIFMSISDIRANSEQAAFEKEVANNDKRRESTKRLFDQKLISQKEYDRRLDQINKEQDKKERELRKKQFEREKAAQTVQAFIGGANAVLSTLSKFGAPIPPNFVGIAAMALTVATSAAQIAAIRSQKAPQFEQGGFIPQGSSHRQGGIALVDNRSGATVGEVEGGEPIISKKVYAANRPLIDSLIAQGSGMSMNIPRISDSFKTMFETGGFIPRTDNSQTAGLVEAVQLLNERLSRPIRANVLHGEYEEVDDRINTIRAQSMVS